MIKPLLGNSSIVKIIWLRISSKREKKICWKYAFLKWTSRYSEIFFWVPMWFITERFYYRLITFFDFSFFLLLSVFLLSTSSLALPIEIKRFLVFRWPYVVLSECMRSSLRLLLKQRLSEYSYLSYQRCISLSSRFLSSVYQIFA